MRESITELLPNRFHFTGQGRGMPAPNGPLDLDTLLFVSRVTRDAIEAQMPPARAADANGGA